MGYLNDDTAIAGKNQYVPSFTTVGYNTTRPTSIVATKPDGMTGDLTNDANALQTINQDGDIVDTFFWEGISAGRGQPKVWDWYKATAAGTVKITTDNDVYIPQGQGFVLSSEVAGLKLMSSGEVEMADVVTNTATVVGKNLIGNPFAVSISLTKVSLDKPEGATADLTNDANALQTIDQGTKLMLANAVCFEPKLRNGFERVNTQAEWFTLADGKRKKVQIMLKIFNI